MSTRPIVWLLFAIFYVCGDVWAEEQYAQALVTSVQRFGLADDQVPFVRICLAVREYVVVRDDLTTEQHVLSPAFVGGHDALIHLEGRRHQLNRSEGLYYIYLNIPDDGRVAVHVGQRFYLNVEFAPRQEFQFPPIPAGRIPRQVDRGMGLTRQQLVDLAGEPQGYEPPTLRPRPRRLTPLVSLDGSV